MYLFFRCIKHTRPLNETFGSHSLCLMSHLTPLWGSYTCFILFLDIVLNEKVVILILRTITVTYMYEHTKPIQMLQYEKCSCCRVRQLRMQSTATGSVQSPTKH